MHYFFNKSVRDILNIRAQPPHSESFITFQLNMLSTNVTEEVWPNREARTMFIVSGAFVFVKLEH